MAENGRPESNFFEPLAVRVAAGETVRAAAAAVGVSERQAYRLSASDEFRSRVAAIRSEATAAIVGRLTDAAVKAVAALEEILSDKQQPGTARVAAAKGVLSALVPITEAGELRQRIDDLERERHEGWQSAAG